MGLLQDFSRWLLGDSTPALVSVQPRSFAVEPMEPRVMLTADPLYVGAVYIEEDRGDDSHGDEFEISFTGGADGTQLTRITIDGDQYAAGFNRGDVIFDTQPSGLGKLGSFPLQVDSNSGIDNVSWEVDDGGSLVVLTFSGFDAGEKFVFKIDVDEVEGYDDLADPPITDPAVINAGLDPVTSGIEFEGSRLIAEFTAPHFQDATAHGTFFNEYEPDTAKTGLDLSEDNVDDKPDRTAGAIAQLQQQPKPISIAGTVYHDEDLDLTQDAGESGLAGVTLALWRSEAGSYSDTGQRAITDAVGDYIFGRDLDLLPGVYEVRETQPSEYFSVGAVPGTVEGIPSGQTAEGDRDVLTEIGILLGDSDALDYDFAEALPARISGFVYHDRDQDGQRDPAEEEGIGGVRVQVIPVDTIAPQGTVTVTTEADGSYTATGLVPGRYRVVEADQPAEYWDWLDAAGTVGGVTVGAAVNPGDQIEDIRLAGGEAGIEYNFGEISSVGISGNVHESDPNGNCFVLGMEHPPIANVKIELFDSFDQLVAKTTTNADGNYAFNDLRPGTYTVKETQPDGYFQGSQRVGWVDGSAIGNVPDDDVLADIVLTSGQVGVHYDFCEHPPARISGHVYHDESNDGTFDDDEDPIEGAQLQLFDAAGNLVAATTTDSDGFYKFTGLKQGTYRVVELQPDGYFDGLDTAGTVFGHTVGSAVNPGDEIVDVGLDWREIGIDYDFGEVGPSSISGYVFQDGPAIITVDGLPPADLPALRDGLRTPDDTPIAGVVLELRNGITGQPVPGSEAMLGHYGSGPIQTTTDARGHYEFTGLSRGNYAVYQVHPDAYVDSHDTAGTLSGIVFNRGGPIATAVLAMLNVDPNHDAIVRIGLPPGIASTNNNFSEVRIEPLLPPPPQEPPVFVPPPVVEIPPPPVAPAVFIAPVVPGTSAVRVASGSGGGGYTWHLSVINSGRPRGAAPATFGTTTFWLTGAELKTAAWDAGRLSRGTWTMARHTREGRLLRFDSEHTFGLPGAVPVVGDFNGDGIDEIAIYYKGEWYIDLNGNGLWDETDLWAKLGTEADQPVVGDWDGDGKDDIGIYGPAWPGDPRAVREDPGLPDSSNLRMHKAKNVPPQPDEATGGSRAMQLTSKGRVRADVIDHVFHYGTPGDRAVSGDWNGDGIAAIGIFRDGRWHLDLDADGRWSQADVAFIFGQPGDLPVVGDFNSDGIDEVGVVRGGKWILDLNGNRELDAADKALDFGEGGGHPAVGDFDGDGIDDAALYHDGGPNVAPQARRS